MERAMLAPYLTHQESRSAKGNGKPDSNAFVVLDKESNGDQENTCQSHGAIRLVAVPEPAHHLVKMSFF